MVVEQGQCEALLEDDMVDQGQSLLEDDMTKESPGVALHWAVYSLALLLLSVAKYIPLPTLVPASLDIGLSLPEASLILASFPVSSVLAMLLQPYTNFTHIHLFFLGSGSVMSLSYLLFYFICSSPTAFLYCGVLLRLAGGTLHFLLISKVAELLTQLFPDNVARVSMSYELFVSIGAAVGPYVGTVLYGAVGFTGTMVAVAGISMITSYILFFATRNLRFVAEEDENIDKIYKLYLSPDCLVYCWLVSVCVGGCMVPVEGMATIFFTRNYQKTVQFGGVILGLCGVMYSLASLLFGFVGDVYSSSHKLLLVGGLSVIGGSLLLVGPVIGGPSLELSIAGYILLQVGSAASQINAVTIATMALSKYVLPSSAMAIVVNATNVAYNLGAFVGPVVLGGTLQYFDFPTVFAVGAPILFLASISIAMYELVNKIKTNVRMTN